MDKRGRYAKPEHERRFLLDQLPVDAVNPVRIKDRYLRDTRLRLRRIETMDGDLIEFKMGHKWRPDQEDPRLIQHTSIYLDETEYELLGTLPGDDLIKIRFRVDGQPNWAVDDHEFPHAGLIVLEVDFADAAGASIFAPPEWAMREVTRDEAYTGASLSRA